MTIAAISTAIGEAGIGIVRISGSRSLDIANRIFKGAKVESLDESKSRRMVYGHIYNGEELVDEVLISYMKGPYTYTREDMVEIYCHGGIIAVRRVLETVLKNGAELAEAGEFTKRAFLNGRLDLSQAEAVMDLINAKTDKSYDTSMSQLEGGLSDKIREIREILIDLIARVEASIDYPDEDDIVDVAYEEVYEKSLLVKEEIEGLLSTVGRGKILRDGLNTVILGKPNVGKSSLLNAILKEQRAIVTDVPGTTRDIIEEYVNIDGIPLRIVDTAGIRDTDDVVEKIGVDRAKESLEDADLIIAVFDLSKDLTEEDRHIIELIRNKKSIIILNKIDLPRKFTREDVLGDMEDKRIIESSMISNIGIKDLEDSIKDMFYDGDLDLKSDIVVTNTRHKNQLEKALMNIEDVINAARGQVPIDCIEVDLSSCWENLGKISGDTIEEDILDRIFSEFCLGK